MQINFPLNIVSTLKLRALKNFQYLEFLKIKVIFNRINKLIFPYIRVSTFYIEVTKTRNKVY